MLKRENNKFDMFDKTDGVVKIKIEIGIELRGQQARRR